MPTETNIDKLTINVLSKAQYNSIQNPDQNELYMVPEEIDSYPIQYSTNTVTSQGIYSAIMDNKVQMSYSSETLSITIP